MYRATDPQRDMFNAGGLIPPQKRDACEKSWAGPFREKALPILLRAEPEFAEFYDEGNGRPNRSVALVLGTLILKEANDLTDEEALNALRFDTRWWCAFDLKLEEADLCQKTLHNFRVKLLASGGVSAHDGRADQGTGDRREPPAAGLDADHVELRAAHPSGAVVRNDSGVRPRALEGTS